MKSEMSDKEKPQIVARHCKEDINPAHKDDTKLSEPKTDLCEFFQTSPLAKVKLEINRNKDFSR